jgi:alpha-L-arabinofuranosidase
MADLENEMAVLNQNGMELVLIVRGVPEWARAAGGHVCGPIAQNKYGAFASFMNELVSRYSRAPYYVKYWELGNEPDAPFISDSSPFGCWGNEEDPYYGGGYYGEMLRVVYPAIKEGNPDSQVLVGGLLMDCDPENPPAGKSCTMSKFLEGILQEGAGDSFDGVSFHSYEYYGYLGAYSNPNWNGAYNTTGPVLDIKANFLYRILESYGKSDKYLMATENALLCDESKPICGDDYETTKAIYAAQTYTKSLMSQVKSSIWYSYTDPWRSTNLIQNSKPTPAYYAFQTVSERLSNTIFHQKIAITGISAYEFTLYGDRVWIAWSLDGQDQSLSLSNPPIRMWDLYGSSITVGQNLTIGMLPVYLEWDD